MARGINQKTRQLRDKIKADIDLGLPDHAISDKHGCCLVLVERLRTSKGIYKQAFSDRFYRAIYLLLNTTRTYADIADEVDLTPSAIYAYTLNLKRHGFDFPARKRGRPRSMVITSPDAEPGQQGITNI